MGLSEKLLLFFSRKPGSNDYTDTRVLGLDNALSILVEVLPGFMDNVIGKQILDFGCGEGLQAVALGIAGAEYVLGVDINQKSLHIAQELARKYGLEGKVEFAEKLKDCYKNRFDIVISQNSMEHFIDPVVVLEQMKSAVKPIGQICITFAPPWYAPYGSHMQFFTSLPWVNIIFSEKTVMRVRRHFRVDGAMKYEEVEGGLNKMTIAKFERIVANSHLRIHYKKYECSKGLNFLSKIPLLRELFINRVSCILSKAVQPLNLTELGR